ncbi:20238_t:CDS:2 [Cetraspora pellucida]|uniref:20238_t:CDS:1 n=1 Tax=Cetraspora pellucida TaxID=1433469 RepID=A0A9N8VWQ6_9GLOM|nr:20238_t:CDS:2 [Cetraspora pellucida]
MPYVPPKKATYTKLSITIKQVNPLNVKNKLESQKTATRDTANNHAVLKLDNLSISPKLTNTRNSLLRKKNGEIVKSSFKNPESNPTSPASPKRVKFNDLKQINIISDDFSDTEKHNDENVDLSSPDSNGSLTDFPEFESIIIVN